MHVLKTGEHRLMSASISRLTPVLAAAVFLAACSESGPSDPTPTPTATVSGVVTAANGAVIEGALVRIATATATTGVDGRFEIQDRPVGSATIVTSAPGFDSRSDAVSLIAGTNTHDVVLTPTPTAILSGVVTAIGGGVVEGATVKVGTATAITDAEGRFEL